MPSTPRKPMPSTANLHVRLPEDEKREISRAAEAQRLDVSTWVRMVLREAAERVMTRERWRK